MMHFSYHFPMLLFLKTIIIFGPPNSDPRLMHLIKQNVQETNEIKNKMGEMLTSSARNKVSNASANSFPHTAFDKCRVQNLETIPKKKQLDAIYIYIYIYIYI